MVQARIWTNVRRVCMPAVKVKSTPARDGDAAGNHRGPADGCVIKREEIGTKFVTVRLNLPLRLLFLFFAWGAQIKCPGARRKTPRAHKCRARWAWAACAVASGFRRSLARKKARSRKIRDSGTVGAGRPVIDSDASIERPCSCSVCVSICVCACDGINILLRPTDLPGDCCAHGPPWRSNGGRSF